MFVRVRRCELCWGEYVVGCCVYYVHIKFYEFAVTRHERCSENDAEVTLKFLIVMVIDLLCSVFAV